MPHHLLQVARTLNRHGQRLTQPDRQQAYLRRAVSTAYYAVFHLLSREAASLLSTTHTVHFSRGFDHGTMKDCCERFYPGNTAPAAAGAGTTLNVQVKNLGALAVPWEVSVVAWNFVQLQGSRHAADYNYTQPVTAGQAATALSRAEQAFLLWGQVANEPVASVFLGVLTTWPTLKKRS